MPWTKKIRHLILVTGLSGAGKSSALKYLEDLGYFWVDNLPFALMSACLTHFAQDPETTGHLAIGVHLRDAAARARFQEYREAWSETVERVETIFLEADADVLIRRYRETRRRHPLADEMTVAEAVRREIDDLCALRAGADIIIDTTSLTVPRLKEHLDQLFHSGVDADLMIFLRSFGFKHGVNTDADMVLDGRFLLNPHYDDALRHLTGRDEPVIRFLEQDGEASLFLDRLESMFEYLIPRYRQEKKRYFTVDIGCTGGKHRSVYLVEQLATRLKRHDFQVRVRHRDLKIR
ncbi:RNase adapter protein RapZ [Candidatus Magnetaquicoccaceae bacterium FCR-1]|uniref:RNase adapter protein RapZ n=1 Tax=Candidatus Magnetaquiglobus chichijimensis TaxID=3141448 RepID=A0ABQ0C5Y4_9PROT